MTKAIYPGRFDPVTKGHMDLAKRAARLFGHVIVAVYARAENPLFTIDERVQLFQDAVKAEGIDNISVMPFDALVVEFARQQGADVMVRGMRAVMDFEAEFDMALTNKKMAPNIESVYLMASLEYLFVSGRRIRELASLRYDVGDLVPPNVAQAIRRKFAGEK